MAILGRDHRKAGKNGPSRDIPDRRKYLPTTFNDMRRLAAYTYMTDLARGKTTRLSRELSVEASRTKAYQAYQHMKHDPHNKGIYSMSIVDMVNQMVKDALSFSNGLIEDTKKENSTMKRKNAAAEKITDTEKEELVVFITNMRQYGESFWWMGIYTGPNDRPKVISTSMRGFFKDMFWRPLETERQSCCDSVEAGITSGVSAFVLTQHCATVDHVRNLINGRTEDELYAEYQYMLNETLDALVDGFGDD